MKTVITLSPILLALLVPVALPQPVHPLPKIRRCYFCTGPANLIAVNQTRQEFLIVRGDDGSVLINWPRVEAEIQRCGLNIDGRLSCGVARALVAARNGSWRGLP